MGTTHVVRGYGPLDLFLAKQRCKMAARHIKATQKSGRILDIGCGSYPFFLITVDFAEKYGIDQTIQSGVADKTREYGITLIGNNIEKEGRLPFQNNYFDVVTLLAVFEHIEPAKLVEIHREIYRILKQGGMYIMTTPAFWTDGLLRFLAKLHLITDVEIKDHKGSYHFSDISSVLRASNFEKEKIRHGYFEIFMNLWVTAAK